MTLGRAIKDAAQRARGRQAARYEIEVHAANSEKLRKATAQKQKRGEIPDKFKQVLFAWERGAKLFVTDAEKVNPNTHAVFFKQYLRQKVTIYREHNNVLPKEFSFKIQSVSKDANGEDERKTIGKVKVDLAPYCDGQVNPEPQEILLQCKPHGKLKVSVKAVWLKDDTVDPDAMTEAGTEMTDYTAHSGAQRTKKSPHKKVQQAYDDEEEPADEQDLSGFDHATNEHDGAGEHGQDGHTAKPRKGKGRGRRRKDASLEEDIPEGCEAPEGDGQGEVCDERPSQQPDEGAEKQPAVILKEQPEDLEYITEGDRVQKPSWRDYICCCCGPQVTAAVDVHETSNLLSDKQAAAMDMENDTTPVEHKKKRRKKKKRPHAYEYDVTGMPPAADGAPQ